MAKRKVFSIGSSLSDGLEQTIEAAQNYSSELRIDIIPLKRIETDPENPRSLILTLEDLIHGFNEDDPNFNIKNLERESLQSLANSILDQGLINPVMVYEYNGMYRLIAGERRCLASALAKKTDIQAKILDSNPDDLKIRVLQWIENIERTDLTLLEKLDNLQKIIDAYAKQNNIHPHQVTITNISQLIGCVKSHALVLKTVLEAEADIKESIAANRIRSLEKAALIANINSKTLRKKALDECEKGATLKHLKILLQDDKNIAKTNPFSSISSAGRPQKVINLGFTSNIKVAYYIFESLNTQLEDAELRLQFANLNLENPKILANAFKTLIKKLEQIHE